MPNESADTSVQPLASYDVLTQTSPWRARYFKNVSTSQQLNAFAAQAQKLASEPAADSQSLATYFETLERYAHLVKEKGADLFADVLLLCKTKSSGSESEVAAWAQTRYKDTANSSARDKQAFVVACWKFLSRHLHRPGFAQLLLERCPQVASELSAKSLQLLAHHDASAAYFILTQPHLRKKIENDPYEAYRLYTQHHSLALADEVLQVANCRLIETYKQDLEESHFSQLSVQISLGCISAMSVAMAFTLVRSNQKRPPITAAMRAFAENPRVLKGFNKSVVKDLQKWAAFVSANPVLVSETGQVGQALSPHWIEGLEPFKDASVLQQKSKKELADIRALSPSHLLVTNTDKLSNLVSQQRTVWNSLSVLKDKFHSFTTQAKKELNAIVEKGVLSCDENSPGLLADRVKKLSDFSGKPAQAEQLDELFLEVQKIDTAEKKLDQAIISNDEYLRHAEWRVNNTFEDAARQEVLKEIDRDHDSTAIQQAIQEKTQSQEIQNLQNLEVKVEARILDKVEKHMLSNAPEAERAVLAGLSDSTASIDLEAKRKSLKLFFLNQFSNILSDSGANNATELFEIYLNESLKALTVSHDNTAVFLPIVEKIPSETQELATTETLVDLARLPNLRLFQAQLAEHVNTHFLMPAFEKNKAQRDDLLLTLESAEQVLIRSLESDATADAKSAALNYFLSSEHKHQGENIAWLLQHAPRYANLFNIESVAHLLKYAENHAAIQEGILTYLFKEISIDVLAQNDFLKIAGTIDLHASELSQNSNEAAVALNRFIFPQPGNSFFREKFLPLLAQHPQVSAHIFSTHVVFSQFVNQLINNFSIPSVAFLVTQKSWVSGADLLAVAPQLLKKADFINVLKNVRFKDKQYGIEALRAAVLNVLENSKAFSELNEEEQTQLNNALEALKDEHLRGALKLDTRLTQAWLAKASESHQVTAESSYESSESLHSRRAEIIDSSISQRQQVQEIVLADSELYEKLVRDEKTKDGSKSDDILKKDAYPLLHTKKAFEKAAIQEDARNVFQKWLSKSALQKDVLVLANNSGPANFDEQDDDRCAMIAADKDLWNLVVKAVPYKSRLSNLWGLLGANKAEKETWLNQLAERSPHFARKLRIQVVNANVVPANQEYVTHTSDWDNNFGNPQTPKANRGRSSFAAIHKAGVSGSPVSSILVKDADRGDLSGDGIEAGTFAEIPGLSASKDNPFAGIHAAGASGSPGSTPVKPKRGDLPVSGSPDSQIAFASIHAAGASGSPASTPVKPKYDLHVSGSPASGNAFAGIHEVGVSGTPGSNRDFGVSGSPAGSTPATVNLHISGSPAVTPEQQISGSPASTPAQEHVSGSPAATPEQQRVSGSPAAESPINNKQTGLLDRFLRRKNPTPAVGSPLKNELQPEYVSGSPDSLSFSEAASNRDSLALGEESEFETWDSYGFNKNLTPEQQAAITARQQQFQADLDASCDKGILEQNQQALRNSQ